MTAISYPQFQVRVQFNAEQRAYKWEVWTEQKPGRYIHTAYEGFSGTYMGATTHGAEAVLEIARIDAGVGDLIVLAKEKAEANGHRFPLGS